MKAAVFSPLHPVGRELLEKECQVEYFGWATTEPVVTPLPSDDEIISRAFDAQVIITPGELSARVIDACPHLQVIGVARGDPRGVDLQKASEYGIKVVYAAGRNAGAVADVTMAFILMATRRLMEAHHFVVERRWKSWDDLFATPLMDVIELSGKSLGLIGFGLIGREVARRALSFGMKILVYDPYISGTEAQQNGVELVELDELLSRSDIVSVHCKLTDETRGMIAAREIALMKPNAYIINTSRAAVIDRGAFLEAMISRRIAGAALDVYWEEPLSLDDELIGLPGLIHTPHVAGATSEMDLRTTEIIVKEVLAAVRGEKLTHLANP